MSYEVILAGIIIMLASLVGVLFIWNRFGNWVENNLNYLATFSAGVFTVISFSLISEAIEHLQGFNYSIVAYIFAGIAFLEIGSRLIPQSHHHHGIDSKRHKHSTIDARRMLLGDAIHNIGDGLLLVPAFLVSTTVGIGTTIAVFIHELVQEVSEFFVLKEAGFTNKEALWKNFMVSSTIFIGIILSFFITSVKSLEIPLIAFAAGGFLYIIIKDLIPNAFISINSKKSLVFHIIFAIAGVMVMLLVSNIVSH